MRKVCCAIHNLRNLVERVNLNINLIDKFNYQILRELENKLLVNRG